MLTFTQTLLEIKGDLTSDKDLFKNFVINYFLSPRFRILLNYRLGKYFAKSNFFLFKIFATFLKVRQVKKWNCDISYNCKIGINLKMPHPIGIVIGDKVILKDNIELFQQVTLGSHGNKQKDKSYPILEDHVRVFVGAKIIGGLRIGSNSIIGANSVVNIDIPDNSIAVGVPCKILNKVY